MNYKKDLFKVYLEEAIDLAHKRKIIILGCRGSGAVTYSALQVLGIEVSYFLDIYTDGKKKMFFGKYVHTLDYIANEQIGTYLIINVFPYFDQMDSILHKFGLIENYDYTNLHGYFKSKYCDKYDLLLGFTRYDDIVGFKSYGVYKKGDKKIVTLGGSTTDDTYSHIKSWPEILHELLCESGFDNIVYNGGICGYMSAQERDKFIRDVLSLGPDIVLCLSGINDVAWNHCNKMYPYYPSYVTDHVIRPSFGDANKGYDKLGLGIMQDCCDYENWYMNQKIISSVANEFGIRYYCFLQPCIFTGSYKVSEFEQSWLDYLLDNGMKEHKAIEAIYKSWNGFYCGAKELISNEQTMYDLTDIFDELSGIYIDGIHCEYVGNKTIAKKMKEVILDV